MVRIAIVDADRCKPKDCSRECYRFCPRVRIGDQTITFDEETGKPIIAESLCSGCGICVRKCPFKAIKIVNLPDELEEECSHRYGVNSFKLYRLPFPKPGVILGLIGPNAVGKTTALKILSGELKPNLGRFDSPPDWSEIIKYYRGSSLQTYFEKLSKGELKVFHKPQYVDKIVRVVKGSVGELLSRIDEKGILKDLKDELELSSIWNREISVLSGGELQRVAIAAVACRDADVYLFDEPSSYLDVYQRMNVAKVIRNLAGENKYVIVVEHDLAVLDYISDQVCIFYGKPGVYGIVSSVYGVRVGINIYLDGYIPSGNVLFRREPVKFEISPAESKWKAENVILSWGKMEKSLGSFHLHVEPGEIHIGEVVGILGPNGIGKTTFVKLIGGILKPDEGFSNPLNLKISYKPQYLSPNYKGSVESLLRKAAGDKYGTSWFKTEILGRLDIAGILDRDVAELSGGELQRVAIAACLSMDADIYLLDEPSAYLDVEQRLSMAKIVRRLVESKGAAAFVVEHDLIVQSLLANSLMVFIGEPGVEGLAKKPMSLKRGMNIFLKDVGVTFRRDPQSGRPRVNKADSWLDRYQKSIGEYYYHSVGKEK
ncbi:MAG: ribosome biogenesis/translation initiation ATPase RLI [archaeon GB-1867-097]|nr:ribosome biogenesis/translation initiation ATPase RLI [Candidatus Culexmicrobium thermophilum]MCS7384563.1 ribosome biogenesis/translation initiation ATPase RLI [Candidatus Culexmicrobium thermophilum]HDO20751.1 ribosome biogenesis/translation initiation ATPase RLI [Candidatus Bathyarchaeota archaeon]